MSARPFDALDTFHPKSHIEAESEIVWHFPPCLFPWARWEPVLAHSRRRPMPRQWRDRRLVIGEARLEPGADGLSWSGPPTHFFRRVFYLLPGDFAAFDSSGESRHGSPPTGALYFPIDPQTAFPGVYGHKTARCFQLPTGADYDRLKAVFDFWRAKENRRRELARDRQRDCRFWRDETARRDTRRNVLKSP